MIFDANHMKERTNMFWDAYFQALDWLNGDRGKPVEGIPIEREIPITDDLMFRIGRNRARWELVHIPTGYTRTIDRRNDVTRALELLFYYL